MKEERPLDYCKQISPTSQFVLYTYVCYKSENPYSAFTREPSTQTLSKRISIHSPKI